MADQKRGRLSRVLMEGVDRAFLGNRGFDYNTGQWNRRGAIQGGIQGGLGAVNPALGLASRFFFNWMNGRNGGLSPATLNPESNLTFTPQSPQLYGPLRNIMPAGTPGSPTFNPANPFGVPQTNQPRSAPNFGPFTPNLRPATGGFVSNLSNQGGGARGMHSQGGMTGDAARAFMESQRLGPLIYNFGRGDYAA